MDEVGLSILSEAPHAASRSALSGYESAEGEKIARMNLGQTVDMSPGKRCITRDCISGNSILDTTAEEENNEDDTAKELELYVM